MDRLLHHELRGAFAALAATAVVVPVVLAVREPPGPGAAALAATACAFALLRTVPGFLRVLPWLTDVRMYDEALPLPEPLPALPATRLRKQSPFNGLMFLILLVPSLVLALVWHPLIGFMPLLPATDWLGRAALIADWERRNGRILWRGRNADEPWALSTSPRLPHANGRQDGL
ncbi:hypothetical protein [Streptomyces sp. NPDC058653]|uniref:hypothetical protein n=1 Tax=Streptomyces sp. NPDC058653 TaxID=3346576 RepID=UPI0036565220